MAKSAVETLVAKIDADIADLERMRAYLVMNANAELTPAAPKKTRKPRKPRGLPADTEAKPATGF
jgi:hypothetical protein